LVLGEAVKTLLLSANLGGFEQVWPSVEQDFLGIETRLLTDETFPRRSRSMTSRLQARIPKMFGWDMFPGYDFYIWLDASFRFQSSGSVSWLWTSLGPADFAFFAHPTRGSVREEAAHIQAKVEAGKKYLTSRYEGEDVDGQLRAISEDGYVDDVLYASMVFCYRPTPRAKTLLTDWWVHTSRFHSVDQLALPFLLWKRRCSVAVLKGDPYHSPYLEYVRGKS
jgi:hypothetical protein